MTTWTQQELDHIDSQEELRIAGRRADNTLRKSVIVWVVRYGDRLFVRSVYGRNAAWYRGVQVRHEGRVECGSVGRDVCFIDVPAEADVHTALDAIYRAKYEGYPDINRLVIET